MPVKQPYYLQTQDPIKLFEPSLQPPVMQQQPLEKKMKPFPMEPYNHNPSEVKVPEFYWDSSYSIADNRAVMAQQANMDRRGKRSPGVFRAEQDPVPRMPFEVCVFPITRYFRDRGCIAFEFVMWIFVKVTLILQCHRMLLSSGHGAWSPHSCTVCLICGS